MTVPAVHIVFTAAAVPDLRNALTEAGRENRVVALIDCFSFGPINPPDPEARRKWVEDELGYTGWEEVLAGSARFWEQALSPGDRKIAWISRRSAQEYAGFLEWHWRLGDMPFRVVDLSDMTILGSRKESGTTSPQPAISVALLRAHQILDNGLLDHPQEISPASRYQYRKLWERLRAENAPLRVLSEGDLTSAPISFFDDLLLSHTTREWQKVAMIVGKTLADFLDTSLLQTGDLLLAARVRTLTETGLLESRGDLSHIRRSEVRLRLV